MITALRTPQPDRREDLSRANIGRTRTLTAPGRPGPAPTSMPGGLRVLSALDDIAAARETSVAAVSLAWLLGSPHRRRRNRERADGPAALPVARRRGPHAERGGSHVPECRLVAWRVTRRRPATAIPAWVQSNGRQSPTHRPSTFTSRTRLPVALRNRSKSARARTYVAVLMLG